MLLGAPTFGNESAQKRTIGEDGSVLLVRGAIRAHGEIELLKAMFGAEPLETVEVPDPGGLGVLDSHVHVVQRALEDKLSCEASRFQTDLHLIFVRGLW